MWIVPNICFPTEVTLDQASISEIWCLWINHCSYYKQQVFGLMFCKSRPLYVFVEFRVNNFPKYFNLLFFRLDISVFTQNAYVKLQKKRPGYFSDQGSKRPHWNKRIIQHHYSASQQQALFDIRDVNYIYIYKNLIYSVWQSITNQLN